MVKIKGRTRAPKAKKKHTPKVDEPLNSDDDAQYTQDQPDPKSKSYFYDDVDEFTQEETTATKYKHRKRRRGSDHEDSSEEEILPLAKDDESDDDYYDEDDDEDGFEELKKMADEFGASHVLSKDTDLEKDFGDDDEDNEAPLANNWGKFKSAYYDDRKDVEESSGEEAEAEESEAMDLQLKLNQQLDEEDFGLDMLPAIKEVRPAILDEDDDDDDQVQNDLLLLSHEDQVEHVITESPELLIILDDVQEKVKELAEEIAPLMEMLENNKVSEGAGADYVRTRYHLLTNYIMNVNVYLMLKYQKKAVQNHPVIGRLIEYKQLLQDLDSVRNILQDEITSVLEREAPKDPKKKKKKHLIKESKKKLSAVVVEESKKKKKKSVTFIDDVTEEEKQPSKKLKKVEEPKVKKPLPEDDELDRFSDQSDLEGDNQDGDEDRDRRSINKKILKNRGLTPHRAKKYGNPRIKNKSKYEKALKRHRSQVPAHRQEIQRYGGEAGGIRSAIVKSVKFD